MPRTFIVGQDEIVRGVRNAMVDQLKKERKLRPGMEIGLIFSSSDPGNMEVEASIILARQAPIIMRGDRRQISAVITNIALNRLAPGESRDYKPEVTVRFRSTRFTDDEGSLDTFFAEVEFHDRTPAA